MGSKVEVKTETRNRSNSGGGRRKNRSTGRSSSSGRQKSTSRGRSSSQVKVEDPMMDKYGHIGEGGDAVKNGRRQESPGGERTGGSRADNSASGEARVTSSSKAKGRTASVGNEVLLVRVASEEDYFAVKQEARPPLAEAADLA